MNAFVYVMYISKVEYDQFTNHSPFLLSSNPIKTFCSLIKLIENAEWLIFLHMQDHDPFILPLDSIGIQDLGNIHYIYDQCYSQGHSSAYHSFLQLMPLILLVYTEITFCIRSAWNWFLKDYYVISSIINKLINKLT